jgi:cytolysin (calcineurin-like family phosphatase)
MFKDPMIKEVILVVLAGLLSMAVGINCGVRADGTATTADETRFTLMIASDPQYPCNYKDPKGSYTKVKTQYEDMNALAADAELNLNVLGCIINGDLTQFGHKYQFKKYRKLIAKLNMPVYPGLGNHDYDYNVKAGRI